MKKIVFIRSNPASPDSRLEKEISAMIKNGYSVSVLGWNRFGTSPNLEEKDGYTIKRFWLKSPVGFKIIFYWPMWWCWVIHNLLHSDWDFVHAADFDTYLPSLIAAKIKRRYVIYDIYDFFPDLIRLPGLIHRAFTWFDLSIMKLADRIIVVDHCRLKQVHQTEGGKVSIIYNSPNSDNIPSVKRESSKFKVFYGGVIYPDRDIQSMLRIADEIEDMDVTVAGMGNQAMVNEITEYCNANENCSFIGTIPYSEVLSHSIESDVLYALYDPAIPNNRLASPNKLFEAMMCGKPIIVNEGVATADKVREENCGLVVPYGDYEALKEAVLTLKNNPELRKELGENGRRAYETKYNWKIMEKRLLNLYASLENKQ